MAHIHEKIDFTSSVYIVENGKVLLHLHKKVGKWLPPGGHIELDEDPNQAARREAKEESGLDVELIGNPHLEAAPDDGSRDLIPPMFINRHNFNESHEHVDFVYFGRPIGGALQSEDGAEMQWFSKEEVEANAIGMPTAVRAYALAALAHFS